MESEIGFLAFYRLIHLLQAFTESNSSLLFPLSRDSELFPPFVFYVLCVSPPPPAFPTCDDDAEGSCRRLS